MIVINVLHDNNIFEIRTDKDIRIIISISELIECKFELLYLLLIFNKILLIEKYK